MSGSLATPSPSSVPEATHALRALCAAPITRSMELSQLAAFPLLWGSDAFAE
uniref:Uncharacterized protein n=1 Tax=Moniliophthora roreri TaxID=221103 RepID=A0A0W0G961_MONRR